MSGRVLSGLVVSKRVGEFRVGGWVLSGLVGSKWVGGF